MNTTRQDRAPMGLPLPGRCRQRYPDATRRGWRLTRRALPAVAGLLAMVLAAAVAAQPIPEGSAQRTVIAGGEPIEVFTYKPAGYQRGPMLLVLHGLGRNADRYRDHARPLADALGYMVAVPRFDAERFPQWRYQWAGIARRTTQAGDGRKLSLAHADQRLDAVLRPLIEDLRRADGEPLPYAVAGHSAGAQALLRWAAFSTPDAFALLAANPGSWLLPSQAQDFPYGLGGLPAIDGDPDRLRTFLSLPLVVLLGDRDLGSTNLTTAPEAMRQGANRLERGRHAFDVARQTAATLDISPGWRLSEVPGAGHSARAMFGSPEAVQALRTAVAPEAHERTAR